MKTFAKWVVITVFYLCTTYFIVQVMAAKNDASFLEARLQRAEKDLLQIVTSMNSLVDNVQRQEKSLKDFVGTIKAQEKNFAALVEKTDTIAINNASNMNSAISRIARMELILQNIFKK